MTKQKTNRYKSRNVKKTKRHGQRRKTRRIKIKRGGMLRALRPTLGTMYYHQIIPFLTEYRNYLLTKETSNSSDSANPQYDIAPYGEKHHTLFESIHIDHGIKESIINLNKELKDPTKWGDKLKMLYDKVTEGLKPKIINGQTVDPSPDSFSRSAHSLISPYPSLQITKYPMPSASNTPPELTNPHFGSPSKLPQYTTELETPPKVVPDEKMAQPIMPADPDDLFIKGTQLFPNDENVTPNSSPFNSPPRVSSKSSKRQLLSPSNPPLSPRLI
jgi:hypothetical protein